MDATYKAHRPPMPDELAVQIPYIHRLVEAFDIPKLSLVGYEADDILGTLARRFEAEGYDVVLVSGDKDLCQLVTDHITILDTMKDQRIGVAEVQERFGVGPEGVIDVLGLMGDSSDNIPGVPGVGEKTAKELMAQFGSLEALLARLDEVKRPKLRENLRQHTELARQSRLLATIDLQTPIAVTLQELTMGAPRLEELRALYKELEFRVDLQALDNALGMSTPPVEKHYRSIIVLEDLDAEIAALRQAGSFAIDTETTNQDPMRAELVGLSLAHKPHEAVYIPLRHSYLGVPSQLDTPLVLERLRPLLEDPAIPKYGQNIKYDYIVLQRQGVTMRGLAFDTMVAGYLINPSRRMNNLDALAREYLNYTPISYEEVAGKGARQVTFDQVEIERATAYSAEDADVALLLTQALRPRLAEYQLESLFHDVEMPLVEVLAALEMRGVMIDAAYLRQMSQHLQVQMEALLQQIYTQD